MDYKVITIRYGIGYDEYTTDVLVDKDDTPEEIEEFVAEVVSEKMWWAWKEKE